MDRAARFRIHGAFFVNRIAGHVHDAAQGRFADGHRNLRFGVGHFLTANQTFGRVHSDRTNRVFAKVLCHFEHQRLAVVVGGQRVQNRGQRVAELHVDHGADHLRDFANISHC